MPNIRNLSAALILGALLAACSGSVNAPQQSEASAPSRSTAQSPNTAIVMGPNVQVSLQNASHFHGEVLADADPVNPQHLIVCSGMWPEAAESGRGAHDVTYVSFDGGRSWKQTYVDHQGNMAIDPTCEIGFDGNADTGGVADGETGHVFIVHSADGGLHWGKPLVLPSGDRDFMTVDTSRSRYRGRVYYDVFNTVYGEWAHVGDIYSTDGGRTFSQNGHRRPQLGETQ